MIKIVESTGLKFLPITGDNELFRDFLWACVGKDGKEPPLYCYKEFNENQVVMMTLGCDDDWDTGLPQVLLMELIYDAKII